MTPVWKLRILAGYAVLLLFTLAGSVYAWETGGSDIFWNIVLPTTVIGAFVFCYRHRNLATSLGEPSVLPVNVVTVAVVVLQIIFLYAMEDTSDLEEMFLLPSLALPAAFVLLFATDESIEPLILSLLVAALLSTWIFMRQEHLHWMHVIVYIFVRISVTAVHLRVKSDEYKVSDIVRELNNAYLALMTVLIIDFKAWTRFYAILTVGILHLNQAFSAFKSLRNKHIYVDVVFISHLLLLTSADVARLPPMLIYPLALAIALTAAMAVALFRIKTSAKIRRAKIRHAIFTGYVTMCFVLHLVHYINTPSEWEYRVRWGVALLVITSLELVYVLNRGYCLVTAQADTRARDE